METLYMICAVAGGTILIVQTVLLVIGGHSDSTGDVSDGGLDAGHDIPHGMDHDVGHDAGHDAAQHHESTHDAYQAAYLKVLTLKTVIAFITFFGLAGMAALRAELTPLPALFIAIGAGSIALYLVAYLMTALSRLQCRGNLWLPNAVGALGKVYLRVPGEHSGAGKVTIVVQGRLMELKAITDGPEIHTGAEVRVVAVSGQNTLDVVPVGKE